jgi:hypothetical protein
MVLRGLFFGFSDDSPYFLLCCGVDDAGAEVCLASKVGHEPQQADKEGVPEGCSFSYSIRTQLPPALLERVVPWTPTGAAEPFRLSDGHPLFLDWNYIKPPAEDVEGRLAGVILRLTAA